MNIQINQPQFPCLPNVDPNAPDRLDPTICNRALDLIMDCLDPVDLVEKKLNPLKFGSELIKHWFRSREQKALLDSHRNLRRMVSQLRDIDNQVFTYAFDHMDQVHIRALRELDRFGTKKAAGGFPEYLKAHGFDFQGQSPRQIMDRLRELGLVEISEIHEQYGGGWTSTPDVRWSLQTGTVRVTPWVLWKPVLTVTGRQVVVLIEKAYTLALGLPVNLDN